MPDVPDYELLRCIGGGSYGDVWLARSATGQYRAVKVLVRSRFGEDSHPFDREFEGLKRFEPVSRNHKNLVDVLHVGQGEELLFYVMELADDAAGRKEHGAPFDAEGYEPDTLSGRLARQGRMTLPDCLGVARSLAEALAHLHAAGLIHRDVKPSNIVFVNGVPKLADVGLVTAPEATLSLVGTEGFIPPEGPGTPQADLFALGKILYELSSGLDRMQFPSLPPWLADDPNRGQWVEFNEIVVHCCEGNPAHRYESAKDLLGDLAHLEEGGSLVNRRRMRRFWKATRTAAVAIVVAGGLFTLGALVNPWRAEPATDGVVPALAAIPLEIKRLELGRVTVQLNSFLSRDWAFSPDGSTLVVMSIKAQAQLWNRELETPEPLLGDRSQGWQMENPCWIDADRLVCRGVRPDETGSDNGESAILLINARENRIVEILYRTPNPLAGLAADPRTGQLAFLQYQGTRKRLYGMTVGNPEVSLWDGNFPMQLGEFSPNGRWLAVHGRRTEEHEKLGHDIWLVPVGGGPRIRVTDRDGFDGYPVWDPGGSRIYYVSGPSLWEHSALHLRRLEIDPISGRATDEVPRRFTLFRDAQIRHLQVVAEKREIVFGVVNETEMIHFAPDSDRGRMISVSSGRRAVLSGDGQWVYYLNHDSGSEGLYRTRTDGSGETKSLAKGIPLGFGVASGAVALAEATDSGAVVSVLDLATGDRHEVAKTASQPMMTPAWSPGGREIAFAAGTDLNVVDSDGTNPRVFTATMNWDPATIQWSPDGTMLAGLSFTNSPEGDEVWAVFVVSLSDGNVRPVTGPEETQLKEGLDWHPSGEFLTYLLYAAEGESEIRQAYPNGRATTVLIDQPEHWDYLGTWHPDGERFIFASFSELDSRVSHIFHLSGERFSHEGPGTGQWSSDGRHAMWTTMSVDHELLKADLP